LRPPSTYYFQFNNSYDIINSAIKTIRNLIGNVGKNNPRAFSNPELLQKVVNIYNNTVHSAYKNKYTPAQVQANREIESFYIKECERKLKEIDELRLKAGFMDYQPNNILLIHIPIEKSDYAFSDKRRRNFDEIGKFVRYEDGNAVVDLLHTYPQFSRVSIPVFYTKYISKDINEYIEKYNDLFIIEQK
jgi:hypothetical protein